MNSHDCDCINPDEWHQNLLEGCNDVVIRLTHVIDLLKKCHQADLPLSRRLRLVGVAEDTLVPVSVKTASPLKPPRCLTLRVESANAAATEKNCRNEDCCAANSHPPVECRWAICCDWMFMLDMHLAAAFTHSVKFAGKRKNAADSAGEVAFSREWRRFRGWVRDLRIQLSFCSRCVTLPDYNHGRNPEVQTL